MKNAMLAAAVLVFAACNVVVWRAVLAEDPLAASRVTYAHSPRRVTAKVVPPESIGEPLRIRIPVIALDATVQKVALTADGAMAVPTRPLDAGWYALGPRPGEKGSAAIAGHVDWLRGASGVFEHLHKVRAGDEIVVSDDRGRDIAFVVREIRKYDAEADAAEVFGSTDGGSHLNIITCDGAWDVKAGRYAKRLVVFADRHEEPPIDGSSPNHEPLVR